MISAEEALTKIRETVRAIARTGEVGLQDAPGHALASRVVADLDMPPFDQSRMDGYAMRDADAQLADARIAVTGVIAAGDAPGAELVPGQAFKVMTGAPVPHGAELVVPVEDVVFDAATRTIRRRHGITLAKNIAPRGNDFHAGDTLLEIGWRLSIADVAVLATAGVDRVKVRAPDRKALVISGGDELIEPGDRLRPGQIRNSNSPTLTRLLRALGMPARPLETARDTHAAHVELIRRALDEADLVVTSGGVSMGDHDVVPEAIVAAGGTIHFDRVAIQPGKPLTFATTPEGKVILSLPGNPCSAFVTCLVFGSEVIARLAGWPSRDLARERCQLATPAPGRVSRRRFLPGRRAGAGQVELLPWNGSGDLLGFARGEVLIVLPENEGPFAAGASVDVIEMPHA